MSFLKWADIKNDCPLDITPLVEHARKFGFKISVRISSHNIDRAKRALTDARGEFDLMVNVLVQMFYDRDILKSQIDEILYGWFKDNIGRFLSSLDEKEQRFVISHEKDIGLSRLAAFQKLLKVSSEALVYQSLEKSIHEYNKIPENSNQKNSRTFLYIFFQVVQSTLNSLGGLTREGTGTGSKKGTVSSLPTTYQSLMSKSGAEKIAKKHEEETGEKIKVDNILFEDEFVEDDNSEDSSNEDDEEDKITLELLE